LYPICRDNFTFIGSKEHTFYAFYTITFFFSRSRQKRFTDESEKRVDYNQMMSYPTIIANRWLGVRLEILGSVIVLAAAAFALIFDIGPATVGLSISYALQISGTLNMLVRMTAEVNLC
jgi:ATP-binding cassette, subfamily C (CFTR/MRP), member 1